MAYQIIAKIKDIIKYYQENDNHFLLERDPSNISDNDFKSVIKIILSYFVDIKSESLYYYDLILFFYKNFINSPIFLKFILSNYPNVISKIMEIMFDNDIKINKDNNKRHSFTKLIMIKLICQILENIKEYEVDDLLECFNLFEKGNLNYENPFIYLYEKIVKELNNYNGNKLIYKYYNQLLLICLNKIFEIENNKEVIKQLIKNDINSIILLLFSNKCSEISENKFKLISRKTVLSSFEEKALFCSESEKSNETGKIICFLKTDINENLSNQRNNKISNYIKDDYLIHFDRNMFKYNIQNKNNKYNDILVIMDDYLESEIYKTSNIESKTNFEIKAIKTDNNYQKLFIKNYSKLILDIIKEEIKKDCLNEKGTYFLLKILSSIIRYIEEKEDLLIIFKYIWNYYEKNKNEENNYEFMSLEFIEDIMDKYFNYYILCHKNIYKDIDDNKSIYNLFNYIINDCSIRIYSKINNKIK